MRRDLASGGVPAASFAVFASCSLRSHICRSTIAALQRAGAACLAGPAGGQGRPPPSDVRHPRRPDGRVVGAGRAFEYLAGAWLPRRSGRPVRIAGSHELGLAVHEPRQDLRWPMNAAGTRKSKPRRTMRRRQPPHLPTPACCARRTGWADVARMRQGRARHSWAAACASLSAHPCFNCGAEGQRRFESPLAAHCCNPTHTRRPAFCKHSGRADGVVPSTSEDGSALAFNGEIFGGLDMPDGTCDAEVLFAALRQGATVPCRHTKHDTKHIQMAARIERVPQRIAALMGRRRTCAGQLRPRRAAQAWWPCCRPCRDRGPQRFWTRRRGRCGLRGTHSAGEACWRRGGRGRWSSHRWRRPILKLTRPKGMCLWWRSHRESGRCGSNQAAAGMARRHGETRTMLPGLAMAHAYMPAPSSVFARAGHSAWCCGGGTFGTVCPATSWRGAGVR